MTCAVGVMVDRGDSKMSEHKNLPTVSPSALVCQIREELWATV